MGLQETRIKGRFPSLPRNSTIWRRRQKAPTLSIRRRAEPITTLPEPHNVSIFDALIAGNLSLDRGRLPGPASNRDQGLLRR